MTSSWSTSRDSTKATERSRSDAKGPGPQGARSFVQSSQVGALGAFGTFPHLDLAVAPPSRRHDLGE